MMENKILNQLDTGWAGRPVLWFPLLDSTNEYGKKLGMEKTVHGTLILADGQSGGKGRRGRSWESPAGQNIYMSLCVEPEFPAEHAAGLTLVMALAAAEAIREVTGAEAGIKWPNDLVLHGRKICGILTELCFRDEQPVVVIGVGINGNSTEFPEELRQTAGSLKLATGKEICREDLVCAVLRKFEAFYEQYEKTEDLSLLKDSYENCLVNVGKEVCVLDPKGSYRAVAEGITKDGSLIVACQDGTRQEISSGEVSVRGIYGYV